MARALAEAGIAAQYSLAGRTAAPRAPALPCRIGGFGGPEGLAAYLRAGGFSHVVDATHPFAAQISRNAHAACAALGLPLITLERPPWRPRAGESWCAVADLAAAARALPDVAQGGHNRRRVFLAIGRLGLAAFADRPGHDYLLRLVDPPEAPLALPGARVVLARGPFDIAGDMALMMAHGSQILVAKNAGGAGAAAKLAAARALGVAVVMIDRPAPPPGRHVVPSPAQVMGWLADTPDGLGRPDGLGAHSACLGV